MTLTNKMSDTTRTEQPKKQSRKGETWSGKGLRGMRSTSDMGNSSIQPHHYASTSSLLQMNPPMKKRDDGLKRKGSLGALFHSMNPTPTPTPTPTPPPPSRLTRPIHSIPLSKIPPPKETKDRTKKARRSIFGLLQKAMGRGGKEEEEAEEGPWGTKEELVLEMDPFGRGQSGGFLKRRGSKSIVIGEP
jgi:hypothetical protein